MELSESRQIAAPPDVVWTHLLDPEVLKACIPGCQELTGTPEDGFEAVVVQKVGPVKATFKGHVSLSEVRPGEGCHLSGEGKGGAAGFARGAADITLAPHEDGTQLSYDVEAKVGGKLAQLGGRVVDGFARRMANEFFDRFKAEVEGPEGESAPAAEPSAAPEAAGPDEATTSEAPAPDGDGDGGPAKERKGLLKRLLG